MPKRRRPLLSDASEREAFRNLYASALTYIEFLEASTKGTPPPTRLPSLEELDEDDSRG